MYKYIIIALFLSSITVSAQNKPIEKYQPIPFGCIKPMGWLKDQMQNDVNGFVGNLDKIVPDLINDPIYTSGRLHKNSTAKELGNLKDGDAEGSEQYKWWNSETQSNWWDGYIRNILLLSDKDGLEKVKKYIYRILQSQDEDGYLGIYSKELRYNFKSENGELWAKTTLYRGLLAYYEFTKDKAVFKSIVKAVDNVMVNYPIGKSSPFYSGNNFNAGVSHGLTFTDVLDKLYQITKNEKYLAYAKFLYLDFCQTYQSEEDAKLVNILNPGYKLKSHGVHTYEHLRPLIVAAYAANDKVLQNALEIYTNRINNTTTLTGGAIGDEWIGERIADATHTGYEYCSLHELLNSYSLLFQKQGKAKTAEAVETIFYNAAQGSRNPNHSCIAYLKTDNSLEMSGTKNGVEEANRKQIRYKYSSAHQDVAVCCNPNAGRISTYFIEYSWLKENKHTIVNALLCPSIIKTTINNNPIEIALLTSYPYQNKLSYCIKNPNKSSFTIKIRKPSWTTEIVTNEDYDLEDDFIKIDRKFSEADTIQIEFKTMIRIKEDAKQEKYFTYGALFYAKSIAAEEHKEKIYLNEFVDYTYKAKSKEQYEFIENNKATFINNSIKLNLKNSINNQIEEISLIPFGKTILRQVSFKQTIQN